MLMPRTHAWSYRQRWLIGTVVAFALVSFLTLVFCYERYYRGPSDAALFGVWQLEIPHVSDQPFCLRFDSDHSFYFSACSSTTALAYGRWYAGGHNIYLSFQGEEAQLPDESFAKRPVILHIVDIEPDTLQLTWSADEPAPHVYRRVVVRDRPPHLTKR